MLESDGYDDALSRYEYLQRIQDQNSEIVGRVRELRDDTAATVERVRATRDSIAAKKAELVRTRQELEAREAQLDAARARSKKALSRVNDHADHLEGDVSDIQDKIQAQLAAASGVPALPAGPIQGGSAGFIWPVNGPIVSRFGMRWGQHARGHRHRRSRRARRSAPPRTARSPSRESEAESGGYGNYTCIDHGGGLVHLLRPPVELRDHVRLGPAGRRDRLRRLHRPLLRRPPPLRGPDQRHRRRSDGLPLDGAQLAGRAARRATAAPSTCSSGSCWTERWLPAGDDRTRRGSPASA